MEFIQNVFVLIGRILISGAFLWGAYDKTSHWQDSLSKLKIKSVPQASFLLPISILLKLAGGLMILFGWHAHIGALLLLIVALPSLFWLHAFWKIPPGPEHKAEKNLFMKEAAIIGGLFLLLAFGGGHFGFGA